VRTWSSLPLRYRCLGKAHGITTHECYTTRLGAFLHRAHARVLYHGLGEISLDTFRLIKIDLPRLSLTSIFLNKSSNWTMLLFDRFLRLEYWLSLLAFH
jgi:hypothetical protein